MFSQCLLNSPTAFIECDNFSEYPAYEDKLFNIYNRLYEANDLYFNGIPVKMKHYPPDYSPKTGLYHLIYENYQHTNEEQDRLPNLERCKRITWSRTLIEYCLTKCSDLLVWDNYRNSKTNTLLFCPELNYLVVLGHRNGYYLLITAYPVQYEHTRAKLLKEHFQYKQTTHPV